MRLRFLAAGGPDASLDTISRFIETANGGILKQVLGAPGLRLWAHPETPILLFPGGPSVLVGRLFHRPSGKLLERFDAPLPTQEQLIDDFWGGYVLFTADPTGHSVLRDPSGSLPVYHCSLGTAELYGSDAEMLCLAGPLKFRPDMDFVRHWLTFPYLRTERTGIAGVQELLPGTCRRIAMSQSDTTLVWDPWRHAAADRSIADFDEAAAMLRDVLLRTIPHYAPDGEDVVLQLSGGLDSSIVAAALAAAGRPFRAVTFATRSADGDERRYARAVAASCSVALTELVEENGPIDFRAAAAGALRPPANAILQPLHGALSAHLDQTGASLVLGGAGGDNVFCFLNTASPALDAFRLTGARTGVKSVLDVAELCGCTFWAAARATIRKARTSRTRPYWRRDESFLVQGAGSPAAERHRWLAAPRDAAQGKKEHVEAIVSIHHFLDGLSSVSGPPFFHPLLSQPVMELCLRIPSWLWSAGGRDRAVAREAFRGLVPDQILGRRNKGRLESMFMKGYMACRAGLEEFLLEGELRAGGVIDADAILSYLRRPGEPKDTLYVRLFEFAAVESWLQSWRR